VGEQRREGIDPTVEVGSLELRGAATGPPAPLRDATPFVPGVWSGPEPGDRAAVEVEGWPFGAWDRYRPEKVLGQGGMGRVFAAFDPRLRRRVAVKVLKGDEPELVARFLREAQGQARVEHPAICKVFEVGEAAGHPFIAMQLVDGQPLGAVAAALSTEQKVLLVREVADAVHAAHRAGLIHRDLKPANVMVERAEDGQLRPYVVDFGLVRDVAGEGQTVAGVTVGTPAYMAPEQARGETVDRRSDVYSLGATLYALLGGQTPIGGSSPMEVMVRVMTDDPVPLRRVAPGVPRDLETIVHHCLEKDPGRRYDSARALADDLGRFLAGEPIAARPPSLAYRLGRKASKHRALVAVGAAGLVAAVTLGTMWVEERRTAARRAELAQRFGQQVEQAEGILWKARSLPLHDVRPTKALVVRRLEEIEAEMGHLGSVAVGPGHAALGRGHLALEQFDEARRHLEIAWGSEFRPPEVAYAMGLAVGNLYLKELAAAQRIVDAATREARRAEAERTLRDPALGYLRVCRGSDVVTPAYVEALLAYYEGRHDEALAKAAQARSAVPWLYETDFLVARVHLAAVDRHSRAGRMADAQAELEAAEAAFAAAARVAESDARAHSGVCRVRYLRTYLAATYLGKADAEAFDRAREACAQGLQADADMAMLHITLARLLNVRAAIAASRGEDSATFLAESVAAAERAVALEPADPESHLALAIVLWERGKQEHSRGADPGPSYDRAAAAAARAGELDPRLSDAHNTAGLIALNRGFVLEAASADPREALAVAARAFARAAELDPANGQALANLAYVHWLGARFAVRELGEDPAGEVAAALAALGAARARNPGWPILGQIEGMVLVEKAHGELDRGQPAGESAAAARAALEKSLAAVPGDPRTLWELANTHLLAARAAVAAGRDPAPSLSAALARGASAAAATGEPLREAAIAGQAALVRAAWSVREGRDPTPDLAATAAALEKARATAAPERELDLALVEARLELAARAGGAARARALAEADRAVARAFATRPQCSPLKLARARLLLLRAAGEADPARAATSRREAEAILSEVNASRTGLAAAVARVRTGGG